VVWLAFTTAPRSVANWARSWSLQDLPSIRFTDKYTDQRRFAARMSSVIATAMAAPPPGGPGDVRLVADPVEGLRVRVVELGVVQALFLLVDGELRVGEE
jgi:hypothetical protein